MNKNKLLYEQPGCKILVVRFEGLLMASGDPDKAIPNLSRDGYGYEDLDA